jgi:23S rRNA (pseudouridine1915-N3)-methyltransferase
MKIKIVCVGKLKDRYFRDAAAEYQKRLSRFCTLEIREVGDEKAPESLSAAEENQVLEREGERLRRHIRSDEYAVALCIGGQQMDSIDFAGFLQNAFERHSSTLTFIIGGSLGLSSAVTARADAKLSVSTMTLPHGLCRVFLLEQIYRAFKINAHEPYHK